MPIKGLAPTLTPPPPLVLGDDPDESGDPPLKLPPLQLVGGELELNVKSGAKSSVNVVSCNCAWGSFLRCGDRVFGSVACCDRLAGDRDRGEFDADDGIDPLVTED